MGLGSPTGAANNMGDVVLVTVKEYAELTGLHEQTVYSAIRKGRFTRTIHRDTGRSILIEVPPAWRAARRGIDTLRQAE